MKKKEGILWVQNYLCHEFKLSILKSRNRSVSLLWRTKSVIITVLFQRLMRVWKHDHPSLAPTTRHPQSTEFHRKLRPPWSQPSHQATSHQQATPAQQQLRPASSSLWPFLNSLHPLAGSLALQAPVSPLQGFCQQQRLRQVCDSEETGAVGVGGGWGCSSLDLFNVKLLSQVLTRTELLPGSGKQYLSLLCHNQNRMILR